MSAVRTRLLKKALSGDEVAQHELLQEYWKFVESSLRAYAGSPDDTADLDIEGVVQITLLQVDKELREGKFIVTNEAEAVAAFEGWLRTIARNRLIDARRTQEAMKRGGGWNAVTNADVLTLSSSQEVLDFFDQDELTSSRVAAIGEAKKAIELALMFLKEISDQQDKIYYEAIRLCFIEGHTEQEAAEKLGVTRGQVSHAIREAKKILKQHLGSFSLYLSGSS